VHVLVVLSSRRFQIEVKSHVRGTFEHIGGGDADVREFRHSAKPRRKKIRSETSRSGSLAVWFGDGIPNPVKRETLTKKRQKEKETSGGGGEDFPAATAAALR
jgi:hypothetical protein